ncbi:MAG: DUF2480 family protein [Chitinophagales bacterium]
MNEKPLINKVAQKAIKQIDLMSFLPKATNIVAFDIKGFLFKELLLKEKDFREALKKYDFSNLEEKSVYVHCSTDAIIPMWAYMLLATYLHKKAKHVVFAKSLQEAEEAFVLQNLDMIDLELYTNQRVVVKGCGEKNFSPLVYITLLRILQPVCKAISFGEACSMVPVFKK